MTLLYSIADYGRMMSDSSRVRAYEAALRSVIKPGVAVLDLGAGTGFFSMLAAKLGAGCVYAIDPNDAIYIADRIARENNLDDRIICIRAFSTSIELESKVDIIISDLRGSLPLYGSHIATLADAKRRLLSPEGILIPKCDHLLCAPIESAYFRKRLHDAWDTRAFGFDMRRGLTYATNTIWDASGSIIGPESLLAGGERFATLIYGQEIDVIHGEVSFNMQRHGIIDGFVTWFEADLYNGIGFSTAPGRDSVYGRVFFPLAEPLSVNPQDKLSVTWLVRESSDGQIWSWITTLEPRSGGSRRYSQSTFYGSAGLSLPNDNIEVRYEARVVAKALQLLAEGMGISDAAQVLDSHFSDFFVGQLRALSWVQRLAAKYEESDLTDCPGVRFKDTY